MKKKILGLVACLGIALFFAINVSINLSKDHSTSGLALKNIEALADGEVPGGGPHSGESCVVDGVKNVEWGNLKMTCINYCTGMSYFSSVKKTSTCL